MEGFRDGSGLFGVAGHPQASEVVARGLAGLVHRGTQGVALAVGDGKSVRTVRTPGHAALLASGESSSLAGTMALGQVHGGLSAAGTVGLPLDGGDRMVTGHSVSGTLAVAIAGRFTNGTRLRRELKSSGALFQTESDAEVLLHLIAQSRQTTTVNRVVDALWKVEGAFAVMLLGPNLLMAVRDARGFRPMFVGHLDGALLMASEDSAIRDAGGELHREVQPGEMVIVDRDAIQSVRPFPAREPSRCIQELLGLARQDSRVYGRSPYEVRVQLGARAGHDSPVSDAEVVVAMPQDEPFGIGFARGAEVPYERGLLPGWNQGTDQDQWTIVPAVVRGKRVVLVTRAILTGRLLRHAVSLLRGAGAIDVHVRIGSPPVQMACVYGVPSPTTDELAFPNRPDREELALWLGADSADWLAVPAMWNELGREGWCAACMTGERPVAPEEADDQLPLF